MPNLIIWIPKDLYERMKKYPEVEWDSLIIEFLKSFLDIIERRYFISAKELLGELGIKDELETISDDVAIKYGLESVEKRFNRIIK